jgi:ubiquinone/menaquinone biosynthesis C-methylase UbiE
MYEEKWKECVLVEPYRHQLDRAMENTTHPEKIKCIVGTAENIPLPSASVDTVLCVRVFHYILNPTVAIEEMRRILTPGGYLVLEMPSKLHFKSRMVSFFKGNHAAVVSATPMNQTKKDYIFVNHNPKTIRAMLNEHGFEVITTLSVSNFRSRLLKRIMPVKFILFLEKALQKPLAVAWFGPSIYFFARRKS